MLLLKWLTTPFNNRGMLIPMPCMLLILLILPILLTLLILLILLRCTFLPSCCVSTCVMLLVFNYWGGYYILLYFTKWDICQQQSSYSGRSSLILGVSWVQNEDILKYAWLACSKCMTQSLYLIYITQNTFKLFFGLCSWNMNHFKLQMPAQVN